ncbi:uncharacterized protein LOC102678080 [Apis dorsata]|uniref:uncharacterized protein LOC102678080 n=1 Tax=Apis dorsata TaxID=7462 RepID=UPI0003DF5A9A|nr:uncharacterized protein LOC102678080 [Apis dorsata]
MCVRGWTAAPCYDERAERRGRWNGARIWYNVATSFIKEVLAVCHVAPHNEAARWALVIAAPWLVFCLPWNGLLCRGDLNPPQPDYSSSRLLHVHDTLALAFVGRCLPATSNKGGTCKRSKIRKH